MATVPSPMRWLDSRLPEIEIAPAALTKERRRSTPGKVLIAGGNDINPLWFAKTSSARLLTLFNRSG
jgi:hypothetical protein